MGDAQPGTGRDCYRLSFDNGYHDDHFWDYPPESEIQDARQAAPDAWTTVDFLREGWDSITVHEWPPLNSDPRDDPDA